ncbi:hypothetical protein FDU21_02585 [Xanthomonas oryzae pv. oryzae]|nr:hypothetical protein FDU21_02585 [Xanthomonas oryzae pv. oryzae]
MIPQGFRQTTAQILRTAIRMVSGGVMVPTCLIFIGAPWSAWLRGKNHWHHDEGDKHYSPGEECPTSDDPPPQDEQEFMDNMSEITGLTGTALVIYLIISEGSLAFPPRNFVRIP